MVGRMKAAVQPFSDARRWEGSERRSALVSLHDVDILFTATWDRPSSLVPRPDGSYRRKYLVTLALTPDHRERSFHQVRSVTLHIARGHAPLATHDVGDVYARDLHSVTLTMYIDDWGPREHASGIISKPPWRRLTSG
jgi:hypothetical protein